MKYLDALGRIVALGIVMTLVVSGASAQTSSMLGDPETRDPLMLERYTWTHKPPRELAQHDLITVLIDEKATVMAEGEVDRRKKADGKMSLSDWIMFDLSSWAIRPDPQSGTDRSIGGSVSGRYRAEAEMETRESMITRMTCRVIDIRPNGNLILEGHRVIRVNNESWELSLSGECRPKDIDPTNTVLSEDIAELQIYKRESGHIREGYRRGWLLRGIDRVKPF